MTLATFSGFLVGILFGFVLQRGNVCTLSSLTDALIIRNFKILRGILWAVLTALIGFHIFNSLGIITLNPKPFFWGANIAGGLIFGVGMALVSGCTAGTTFKAGTGFIGYFVAALGIAIGGLLTMEGFIKPLKDYLQTSTKIAVSGKAATLNSLFHVNSWIVVIILSAAIIWLLIKLKSDSEKQESFSFGDLFKKRWPAALTGILIGITGILAFISSSDAGRNYPLGIVEGYVPILKSFLDLNFNGINWLAMLVLGTIFGASVAAIISGEFKLSAPNKKQFILMLAGGMLMGIGAIIAAGCTVTHILSGIPQLSIGSIVSSIAIFIGAYLVIYFKILKSNS